MTAAKFEDSQGPQTFALAMAETDLGVALYDARNKLLFWNERCRVLSGYPYELFFTGSRLEEHVLWSARQGFFGTGDPAALAAERMTALATPGVQEIYFFRPTGEPVVLRAWRHLGGTLLCVIEERLDYRNFVAAAREGFVIGDHQGRIVVVNPGAEALFGYSRSELYGRPLDMLFSGTVGIAELWRRGHQGQGRATPNEPVALSGVRKRGGQFAAEVSIVGVESRGSQILGLIVRDVTAKARAEEALKQSRATLERRNQEHETERRRIERLTKAGHWGWKNDPARPGMLDAPVITSESFLAICGLPAGSKITMRAFLEQVVHPADREQLRKSWLDNLGLKTTGIDAFRVVRPDGEIRWVYDMFDPVRDESGHLVGDNATLLDVTEIKRTEAALQRQQALLISMERIAGVGGWEFDAAESKELWTDGLYLILGRTRQEMEPSTDNYFSCVHQDDRAALQGQFEDALRGAASSEAEYRVVRPDGSERKVSSRIEILRDDQNRVQRIIGAVLDVTQARRAEEALRESRAALELRIQEHESERRRIERLTKIGYWSWRRDPANPAVMDGLVMMSDSFLALCGLPQGLRWTNRDFLERVVHPDDRERLQRLWIEMTGVEFAGTDDFRIVLPDGKVRYVYNLWESFCDEAGNVVGDNQTLLDATDIKRTEAALQRHQALLSTMERISGVGGWEFDPGERRVIWTEGLYLILGRSREAMEPSTENYLTCVHDDDREFVRAQFESALRGEASAEAEYRIARPGGEERIVSARIEVLRDEKGRVRRIVGAVADRTEARRTEAALRQAQRLEAVGHLTGGIAHDFNNLLGVITGNLELMLENPAIDARTQRLAKRAVDGARHGAELTKRLLAFSRRQSLWPRNVDLNELLSRMVGMLERTLGEQIAVEVRPASDLWPCRVDPAQINDTILNLAINARDAMPKGGRLILATDNIRLDESYAAREADVAAGDYVSLSVSDSGIGMTPEVLARAFEPFYTTKEEGKGTGLGLSMVWGFVKQSKGHIRIYSEVGRGTTVRIYLPRATTDDTRETEPAQLAQELPRGNETLLVVEDNERLRRIAIEQLESLGYDVLEAESAEAALVLLTGHPEVALVYSDIVMSGAMTGYDLAREASKRYPQLKVLLATGYASQSLALPKPEDNHFTVLHKPVPLRELAAKIRGELEKGASRQPVA